MSTFLRRELAVITGGSSGIGFELAKQFLEHDFDVLIAADREVLHAKLDLQRQFPQAEIMSLEIDLSTLEGIETLYRTIQQTGRAVAALAANAGIGLGLGFLDEKRADWIKIIQTNVVGTLDIIHLVGRDMRKTGKGRILITSSIASTAPSPYLALYSASKAFLQSFSFAIRNELADTGVSVTALLPGATQSDVWERAGVMDTKLGAQPGKDDPADVAKSGFEALMAGKGEVIHGWKNKLAVAGAKILPDNLVATLTKSLTEPGANS